MTETAATSRTRRVTVKQVDLTRALRAHKAAGIPVTSTEIDTVTGKITILSEAAKEQPSKALDQWLEKHGARQA